MLVRELVSSRQDFDWSVRNISEGTGAPVTTRRQLLHPMAAVTISSTSSSLLDAQGVGQPVRSSPGIRLGAQTNAWAMNPNSLESFIAVLEQIRQVGYGGFETGFLNLIGQFDSPAEAKGRIAATGLTFFGIHIAMPFDKDDAGAKLPPASIYEKVARGGLALGAQHLIFSAAPAATVEDLERKIETLENAGRFSKSIGLPLAYHNHWWEFQSKIGEIEALYAQTDPALVSFLLDAGHAYRGGANVPDFLRRHSKRLIGLHLRDYKNEALVPLGQGSFPLTQVAATLKQLHWKGWVLNEEEREDGTKYGLNAITPAFQALQRAFQA